MDDSAELATPRSAANRPSGKPRGGRPTRVAAAERDERLLEIATRMFMEQGFDTTSMERLAEAAAIGKATLYARYADKTALFAAVLRRRILEVYGPLEEEFAQVPAHEDLATTLTRIAARLLAMSLSDSSVTLGRILSAQGPKFPDLARLAISEGTGRPIRIVETVLARYADDPRYDIGDRALAADLFLALVLGRASRFKIFGLALDPVELEQRTAAAVALFVRGIAGAPGLAPRDAPPA